MAFKKGSAAAKAHMAKIRAAKVSGPKKKVSKNQLSIFDVAPKKAAPKKASPKKAAAKKKVVKQTGTSNKQYDKMRQALPAGIRISQKTVRPYKEVRANRSDKGVLLGVGSLGLSEVVEELTTLEIKIIQFKEDKKIAKLKSEKSEIQYRITILNNQHKALKVYLNTIAKFTYKTR